MVDENGNERGDYTGKIALVSDRQDNLMRLLKRNRWTIRAVASIVLLSLTVSGWLWTQKGRIDILENDMGWIKAQLGEIAHATGARKVEAK